MDITLLKDILGDSYRKEGEIYVSREGWQQLKAAVQGDGSTPLMQAAKDGDLECVDALLRCGINVNAKSKCDVRRAIDFALEGDHHVIVLLLLKWDSLLPVKETESRKLMELRKVNEEIDNFFKDRLEFHQMIGKGEVEEVNKTVTMHQNLSSRQKYWVNDKGESALYTALLKKKVDMWALLMSHQFICEENFSLNPSNIWSTIKCGHALDKYFVSINRSHIYKMLGRSKVIGGDINSAEKIKSIYKSVDEIYMSSLILLCLQDDVNFDVVFEMRRSDVSCVYGGVSSGTLGLMDPLYDRVYIAAHEKSLENYKDTALIFSYSNIVSTFVHELAHKVMHIVFKNYGLPYKKDDIFNKKRYEDVVSNMTEVLDNYFKREKCDEIFQSLTYYPKYLYGVELIVRVPEMVSKYHLEDKDGIELLMAQAPDLYIFYSEHVVPEMEAYAKRNQKKNPYNKIPAADLRNFPELLCNHKQYYIEVKDDIEKAVTSQHNNVNVLQVTNLKLGVSHLEKSHGKVLCVDWTKYLKYETCIEGWLRWEFFNTVAITWDKEMGTQICSDSLECDDTCPASRLESQRQLVTLLIPKNVIIPAELSTYEYSWQHLSDMTRDYILDKSIKFQGRKITLRKVLESIVGEESVLESIGRWLDSDDVSFLIDTEEFHIGNPLQSVLEERGMEMLRKNLQGFIERKMKLRPVELDEGTLDCREQDAFFIFNAKVEDLRDKDFDQVCVWEGMSASGRCQCFILAGEWNPQNKELRLKEITERLKWVEGGRQWQYAHFYVHKKKKFIHLHSEEIKTGKALIISGPPGIGKSVYVNRKALELKRSHLDMWIDVIELTRNEDQLNQSKSLDFSLRENVESCLFDLMNGQSATNEGFALEKKIFSIYCQVKDKVFIHFDGFDEICPDHKEIVTSLLEALLRVTKVAFCVTTREHEGKHLEECLFTISRNLVPFNREDQLEYINSQWNFSLRSLPQQEKKYKMECMTLALNSLINDSEESREIAVSIKVFSEDEKGNNVNFDHFAKQLLKLGKSVVKGDEDFLQNPLQLWMMTFIYFENNFTFHESFNLSTLYQWFVDMKIEIYCREKMKVVESQHGKLGINLMKKQTYSFLIRHSVYIFLGYEEYQLPEENIHEMLKVGLLSRRDYSAVFVHRTFGEYLLCLWVLGNAEKETEVSLSRIFLAVEMIKVREFLNGILQSEYRRESSDRTVKIMDYKRTNLNRSSFPNKKYFVIFIQKCVFKCIAEVNKSLLHYLLECSGESLGEVVFRKGKWDLRRIYLRISKDCNIKVWSAFTLIRELIIGRVDLVKAGVKHSDLEYIKLLSKFIKLIISYGFITNLNQLIIEQGLCWMGIDMEWLWSKKGVKEQYKEILRIFVGNVISKTMKKKIMNDEMKKLLQYSACQYFDLFQYILESFLNEGKIKKLMLKKKSFIDAFTRLIRKCELGEVKMMWYYIDQKLATREERRKFLQRKDADDINVIRASLANEKDPRVVCFMWELLQKEFDARECKSFLFDAFPGVSKFSIPGIRRKFPHPDASIKHLLQLLRDRFLDGDEVARVLLGKDKEGKCYLLALESFQPPTLYAFQELLSRKIGSAAEVIRKMEGQYVFLTEACFFRWDYEQSAEECFCNSDWIESEFISIIESEFADCLPPTDTFPLKKGIRLEEDMLINVETWYSGDTNIHHILVKAYVVLLNKQLKLEEEFLGSVELSERMKRYWFEILYHFPQFRVGDGKWTRGFIIRWFFAILSKFVPREQVGEILIGGRDEYSGTVFHVEVSSDNHESFFLLYDVARWCMGENALHKVHSIGKGGYKDKTVLELFLELQEEGEFNSIKVAERLTLLNENTWIRNRELT